jgi:hypothetical protein
VMVNECSPYTTKPSPELLAECNEFLGPTQPGVTTPDPTETHAHSSASTAETPRSAPQTDEETALDFLLGE